MPNMRKPSASHLQPKRTSAAPDMLAKVPTQTARKAQSNKAPSPQGNKGGTRPAIVTRAPARPSPPEAPIDETLSVSFWRDVYGTWSWRATGETGQTQGCQDRCADLATAMENCLLWLVPAALPGRVGGYEGDLTDDHLPPDSKPARMVTAPRPPGQQAARPVPQRRD